ncbi:MAG: Mut7-C RNAse domain-containing protein [Candidatus Marinimicrobia bacterium]|nr:Mut7-C RNAse domain-containing protein [Candidatus Neomarinimicrobiota bacterium]MCF7828549.1 Mut7-C RNAse domain-containing protein [Candidatus Neomarinimicrobiota bacterium]MCF7882028.1 Mut7-C RNAse domain-containing protein [Candidatus Neomarinimicrobiota bacterium]
MPDFPGDQLQFTADLMLKRLAKYLRALGYDTLFDEGLADHELLAVSKEENRVLLTRDLELYEGTPAPYSFYVNSQYPNQQFRLIAQHYPLEFDESRFMERCLECNTVLNIIPRDDLTKRVPPRVYKRHDTFYHCPACHQIFWHGDHVKRLREKLTRLLEDAGG